MSNKIYPELDAFFETLGLLMISSHFADVKKDIETHLPDMVLDVEDFYVRHMKIFDRYVQTFQKYKIIEPEAASYFDEGDSNYFTIFLSLLNENRNLFSSIDDLHDNVIKAEIINTCKAVFDMVALSDETESLDDIILFLDRTSLAETAKWKLVRIMQNPKHHLKQLINAVNNNIDAFHKAQIDVQKPLTKLLQQYKASFNEKRAEMFSKIKNSFSQTSDIHPTLIFPLSQLVFENNCYYGLLSNLILKGDEDHRQPKEKLLLRLKALSDRSKLEIICSLKNSPKYNLEIAEQMKLKAPTMSHHMSVLLTCGFVGIQKHDGRVYYHLEQAAIKQFIEELQQTLL